jgi:hypothetical protein
MNKQLLIALFLLAICTQCKPSFNEESDPCRQINGNKTPRSIQAYLKKDICTACLDLFVTEVHAIKMTDSIDFIIQDPDLFNTWKHRYGNNERIVLMDEALSKCIDTALTASTIYFQNKLGEIQWKSILDSEHIPSIIERLQ